jgi:class 3 adenylate cyclase
VDIGAWLRDLGMAQYERVFRDNAIDLGVIAKLTDRQLKELGVAMGHRIQLLKAAQALGTAPDAERAGALRQGDTPSGQQRAERRQLAVMFVDLVGSTQLSTKFDPEVLGELIQAYQNAVAGEVTRFDGSVAKFMGDGVLAYFGWPHAHEDDAERAVRAGLAVIGAVRRLTTGGDPLSCRVGIATGLVVVGDLFCAGGTREETLVGETPNLAARLQQVADAHALVVCPETRRLVGELFSCADLGALELKGFTDPMRAWRVVDEITDDRFAARHSAGMSPLVGREAELRWLTQSWDAVREGEGCVRILTGEAGIGKSRLLAAMIEHANHEHTQMIFQYACSPYHVDSALWPVIGQLERAAGFARADRPSQRLEKLEALVLSIDAPAHEMVSLLAELLELPAEGRYARLDLTPAQRRSRTLEALVGQMVATALRIPVMLVVEDAHWLDPTTSELLDRLNARMPVAHLMIVVTSRPEFVFPWADTPQVEMRTLSRLSQLQTRQLIEHVAAGRRVSEQVASTILSHTEGVPLFVEELTKTILESAAGNDSALDTATFDVAIPTTLQGSLMARLDRLGPAKAVAQLAACIGREFTHDLLAAVAGLDAQNLDELLRQLCYAELLFAHGVESAALFVFKHALIRDAAYESLHLNRDDRRSTGESRRRSSSGFRRSRIPSLRSSRSISPTQVSQSAPHAGGLAPAGIHSGAPPFQKRPDKSPGHSIC